ncbi:MAG TPA: c-type cytochrome [Gammaproteobacteria bacterium]|nr:c-type cytochrome [Gammaproteobacteria bacterium]
MKSRYYVGNKRILRLAALFVVFGVLGTSAGAHGFKPGKKHGWHKTIVLKAFVPASTGGVFTDNPYKPRITIRIPPGALSADAKLIVKRKKHAPAPGGTLTAAGSVYRIWLRNAHHGWRPLTLDRPMEVALATDRAPQHPQLGEVAIYRDGGWQRMMANFYRAPDSTVLTRTRNTHPRLRAVFRTLQARSGPEVERGRILYTEETWGDEAIWGDFFELHKVLNNVTPNMAVGIGAQVDISKVPKPIVDVMLSNDFAAKQAALDDPAVARALLKADAIVGVRGVYDDPDNPDRMTSVGLTCAICHVTVKPTPFQLAPDSDPVPLPIGPVVFGPPNTRMDAGLLLSFTPRVQPGGSENVHIAEYQGWGPGRIDPRFFPNNPFNDGVFNPSSIPQHWNYLDLAEQGYAATWIGVLQTRPDNHSLASAPECGIDLVLDRNGAWGTPNASIKNIEIGNPLPQEFLDRLEVAEITEPGNDLRRQDLLDLEAFLQSIVSPAPGPFDEAQAEQGWRLFYGKANCAACHSSGEGTGAEGRYFTNIVENPPQGLLSIGIKTPGLRGLAYTAPYFHDGSAATLADVVKRYTSPDIPEVPDLSSEEQAALVEYLKSL